MPVSLAPLPIKRGFHMLEPITITLADKSYAIQQLTIGQDCDLRVGVVLPQSDDPQENIRRAFERNVSIIVAALSADYPELTRDNDAHVALKSASDVLLGVI